MIKPLLLSAIVAGSVCFLSSGLAAGPSTYQVTGPVLEMNDTMIAVQKGKDRWEISRNASTSAAADVKVGDKVTITYTMTATKIVSKTGKADSTPKGAKNASPAAPTQPKP
jgi:hypothetical protein